MTGHEHRTGAVPHLRICKIAGRYLVFDPETVSRLRRNENTNGMLVGTTPQQPTQNIFLGLPVEIRPEEAIALVDKQVAYIVDDVAAHEEAIGSTDKNARRTYVKSLRMSKDAAQNALAKININKATQMAGRNEHHERETTVSKSQSGPEIMNSPVPSQQTASSRTHGRHLALTPVTSNSLISCEAGMTPINDRKTRGSLARHLQSGGYYMTPGLRFGAKYSVYPGDPLRFHAHFMANEYDWDEQIPILDIVGGGRLATAVKKAFLICGQQPSATSAPDSSMLTYSIEWAAM